ncbi:YtpR family tRNA-binding protein [Spiroplasma endosymbiont of Crioceris asparagi]|uniref:YtpR family tRNA-binding protein n=1 Tax=Spiroplasma endosymbiont of Crioceris asparagi TaxID=3066286 RepID=UPI0030CD9F05
MKVNSSKVLVKYNDFFKTLFILFSGKSWNQIKEHKNMIIMLNDDEIVAINVIDIEPSTNLVLLAKKLIKDNLGIEINLEPQFVVVEVMETTMIPNTHLTVCKVFDGKQTLQVVCGAANVKKGMKTILATVGSWMPSGLQITKGKLSGYESFGMLCSAKELNIKNKFNDKGIIELSKETVIGQNLEELI